MAKRWRNNVKPIGGGYFCAAGVKDANDYLSEAAIAGLMFIDG